MCIAIVSMIRLFFSFMLMIAAMTFNAMVVVCILLGLTTAYLVLGFDEIRFDLSTDGMLNNSEFGNKVA